MRVWSLVSFAAFLVGGCLHGWDAISELRAGDPEAVDSAVKAALCLHIASLNVLIFWVWGDRS